MKKLRKQKTKIKQFLIWIAIILIYYWALKGTNTDPKNFVEGIPHLTE